MNELLILHTVYHYAPQGHFVNEKCPWGRDGQL
jgi:hypothetical protein